MCAQRSGGRLWSRRCARWLMGCAGMSATTSLSCWHDFRRALACTERLEIGCLCHTSKFSSAARAEDDYDFPLG